MYNDTTGVVEVTPNLKALLDLVLPKTNVYPWYDTPVGGEFARPLRFTKGETRSVPKGVLSKGLNYDVSVYTYNGPTQIINGLEFLSGERVALYRRVA